MKFYTIRIWNGTSVKTVNTSNPGKVKTYREAFARIMDLQGHELKIQTERGVWTANGGPCLEVLTAWRNAC